MMGVFLTQLPVPCLISLNVLSLLSRSPMRWLTILSLLGSSRSFTVWIVYPLCCFCAFCLWSRWMGRRWLSVLVIKMLIPPQINRTLVCVWWFHVGRWCYLGGACFGIRMRGEYFYICLRFFVLLIVFIVFCLGGVLFWFTCFESHDSKFILFEIIWYILWLFYISAAGWHGVRGTPDEFQGF